MNSSAQKNKDHPLERVKQMTDLQFKFLIKNFYDFSLYHGES